MLSELTLRPIAVSPVLNLLQGFPLGTWEAISEHSTWPHEIIYMEGRSCVLCVVS